MVIKKRKIKKVAVFLEKKAEEIEQSLNQYCLLVDTAKTDGLLRQALLLIDEDDRYIIDRINGLMDAVSAERLYLGSSCGNEAEEAILIKWAELLTDTADLKKLLFMADRNSLVELTVIKKLHDRL